MILLIINRHFKNKQINHEISFHCSDKKDDCYVYRKSSNGHCRLLISEQAAIGSVPLAVGLSCGEMVLSVSLPAIFITAPLGSLGIEASCSHLLTKESSVSSSAQLQAEDQSLK